MAKKRVHEIAKEKGISSKEVIGVLQAAGLDVNASASSVDEDDIRRAFSNGGEAPPAPRPQERRPTAAELSPPGAGRPLGARPLGGRPMGQRPQPADSGGSAPAPPQD